MKWLQSPRPVSPTIGLVLMMLLTTILPASAGPHDPDVRWKDARESFSTPPEAFVLDVDWKVAKGFGERLDVEINGGKTASHWLPGETTSGSVPLKFDGKKLGPGEHVIRVCIWQGNDKHRDTRGWTKPLRVLVAGPAEVTMPEKR
ncbi:MAG: hypothetical protein ACKO2G_03785 [Verrucomicrobiales bacterium]